MIVNIDGIVFSLQKQGGISVYFHTLLDYLSRQNLQTIVSFSGSPKQEIQSYGDSISLTKHPSRFLERYRSAMIPSGCSVFHSSYYRKPRQCKVPTVVTVHDFIYERYQHGPRKWIHTIQKNSSILAAQAVICVSESTKQDLLEYVGEIPGQEVFVIHNGVSEIYKTLDIKPSSIPFVLFVGLRSKYKNFRLVVEAMRFLPELELHCVGGGDIHPNELKGLSSSITKRVRHLGFVSDQELNYLYNRAICLVYPSSYEGFGIPVLEAMKAGCPVVSTDCKAVIEVGGESLIVVPEQDPKVMSEAILKTTSLNRHIIINQGLLHAKKYSWDETHRQTLEVYRSLSS